MSKKFGIKITGLDTLLKKLEKLDVESNAAINEAMVQTQSYINQNLTEAMESSRYNFDRTGKTKNALEKGGQVYWVGSKSYVDVGFRISNGGMPSIFLMYGTPKITPDKNLFNAILGKTTKNEVTEIQTQAIQTMLRKAELK